MDNLTRSSGVDRGEMVPPIPTRRTKRKMMTTEDSKPLNTGMNEQTIFIMPPPRRKHKPQHSQPNPNSSSDEHENVFPEETNKDNRVTHVLNSESASVDRGMSCRPTLTASAEKDLVENPRLPTNKLTDHKVCSELKILNFESNLGVLLDLDGEADSVEQDKKNSSDLTHNHRSCNESNIFEMFIDNRVLDVPLVAGSHEPIDEILEANNEVKMSIPENSATIVGVFYKPEFSSLSKVNECKSDYQQTNLDVDTRVWQKSTVDCSGKATLGVLDEGSKNIENKISIKETEENDSGVYFSDTKSPPFRETYLDHEDLADKEEKNVVNLPHYSSSHYPFNCNDRDTFDNKNLEDFSSKSYRIMLDDFEGQTVKAQRDEVTSLFSVCNGELSKTQVVEDWLDNGKYLLEKKSNSNRNFTEYLKTMLNTESQRDSLSPYPLSTVDEDDRSDIVLDDLQESRLKEVVVRNVLPGASFTKPTSSLDLIESSVSSSNNNRPIDVIVDNVNIFYVNTDCKFAPDKSEHVYSEVQNTPKVVQNPKQNPQKVLVEFDKFTSKVTTKPVTSVENSSVCNLNLDLNLNTLPTPSSAIKQGAVTSLIAYFENIKHQEFEPVYSDEGLSVKEDESVPQSEEDAESESMPSRDLNDSFENYERFLNTTDEIIKDTCEAEDYTNEICCPSVVPKNCKETLTNEQFPEFKDLPKVEALSEDDNQTLYLFENEPEFEVSVSDTNSDFEPQPEGNPTVRTIEKNIYIENRNLQPLKNVESIYEAKYEETKQQLPENTNHSPLSTSLSYSIENQLNDTSVVDLIDNDYLVEVEATVPTICNATKEVVNSEVSLPAFKPTMIPIVVLTEADLETSLIGSIELHSSQQPAKDITDLSPETTEYAQSNQHFENDVESLAKSEIDPAAIEVVLEKNWGSVGLKLQGDDEGVFVSDILPGGSADESGLIFKGWINIKKMAGQEEIFC